MKKLSIILLCCLTLVGCGATAPKEATPPPEDTTTAIVNEPTPADEVVYMTDEELLTWAEAKLPKAMAVRNIFCGDALPYDEAEKTDDGFVPTDSSDYTTIAALKAATEEIYTKSYADEKFYAKALDSDTPLYKEMNGKLCVNPDLVGKNIEDAFDFSTLRYVSAEEGIMKFAVQGGKEAADQYEITIRSMVGDHWLIDGVDLD